MIAVLAGFGLILGKLAEVFLPNAHRDVKVGEPPIRCPKCERATTLRDAIPLGDALNRGRCIECAAALPIRWLFLPVGTAILAAVCYLRFDGVGQALVGTIFCAVLLGLVFTDLERRRLPDRIVLPSIVAAGALGWILPDGSLLSSAYGGLVGASIAAALLIGSLPFGGGAFGMGDAKLIVLAGVLLGPSGVVVGLFIAIISSGLFALVLLAARLRRRGSYMPLGPFLVAGAITSMLWGMDIWDRWTG